MDQSNCLTIDDVYIEVLRCLFVYESTSCLDPPRNQVSLFCYFPILWDGVDKTVCYVSVLQKLHQHSWFMVLPSAASLLFEVHHVL